jgi:hypothetical protein
MRTRITVAAVTGALALSALAAPTALADGSSYSTADAKRSAQAVKQAAAQSADASHRSGGYAAADTGTPYQLDFTFSNVKVNKGQPIAVGVSGKRSVPVTYTVTHGADVDLNDPELVFDVELWRGTSYDEPAGLLIGDDWPVCTATSATTASCNGTIDIYPAEELLNADATTWKVGGYAVDWNGEDPASENVNWDNVGAAVQDSLGTSKLLRASKLTVNASPEPVRKGKVITVTGRLTRADWTQGTYANLANQYVKLLYKKSGASTWTTLKTIKSSSTGYLSTTTTATYDGYYRFSYAGGSTTAGTASAYDFIDVQ